jgi:hypothetical protein
MRYLIFEVLTLLSKNITVLQDVTSCIILACFEETCCPHLQGRKDSNDELRNLSRPMWIHDIIRHLASQHHYYTLRWDVRLPCVTVWYKILPPHSGWNPTLKQHFFKKKGLYCSDSLYKNIQRYVQLFLTPIDYCGLRSSLEVAIRTIRRNDGRGSENNRQGKNTAVGGWGV